MVDWHKVVTELGPRLMRYFVARYPKAQAADMVQEVFLRLVRRHREGAIDPMRGDLVMFAFGIAKNLRLEMLKASKATPIFLGIDGSKEVADDGRGPDIQTEEAEQRALLRRAISQLSVPEQQVVMLYMDDDLSLPEIGSILDMPTGTVKSHMHRAKENLKKYMTEERKSYEQ